MEEKKIKLTPPPLVVTAMEFNPIVIPTVQPTPVAKLTATEIRKLNEKQLVDYANSLGIPATTKDRKADTLAKILKIIN